MKDASGNVRTLQSPRGSDEQAKSQNRAILTVSHERVTDSLRSTPVLLLPRFHKFQSRQKQNSAVIERVNFRGHCASLFSTVVRK